LNKHATNVHATELKAVGIAIVSLQRFKSKLTSLETRVNKKTLNVFGHDNSSIGSNCQQPPVMSAHQFSTK